MHTDSHNIDKHKIGTVDQPPFYSAKEVKKPLSLKPIKVYPDLQRKVFCRLGTKPVLRHFRCWIQWRLVSLVLIYKLY